MLTYCWNVGQQLFWKKIDVTINFKVDLFSCDT